jgi:UDP-sulfoquinovose synthase
VSEVRSVLELAKIIEKSYGAKIDYKQNPRKELAENELEVSNAGLVSLGFEPIKLDESLVEDVKYIAELTKERFNPDNVMTSPKW